MLSPPPTMTTKRTRCFRAITVGAVLLVSTVFASCTQERAVADPCDYSYETGHYVCNEFLDFYNERGQVDIFGYPLTEAFIEKSTGLYVQYFQRVQLELHLDNTDQYKVLLGPLVDDLEYKFPAVDPPDVPPYNSDDQHYFPETHHVVSYDFLDFFRELGGVDFFGHPASETLFEEGYAVQYFQRARMEWHPYDPGGPRMRLTNLGERYLARPDAGIPPSAIGPLRPPGPGPVVRPKPGPALFASATVRHITIESSGTQTIFVFVADREQVPVEGANVGMTVQYPSGDQSYNLGLTNASGFASRGFAVLQSPPGQRVVIDVTAMRGASSTTTQAFFLPHK